MRRQNIFRGLASLLAVFGASQWVCGGTFTWNVAGPADFNVAGNWNPNTNVPAWFNDDLALINNGGTAFLSSVPDGPAAIVLGQNAGSSGTLEIRNGGTMNVIQSTTNVGSVTVGGGGTGTLRVLPGGTLNTILGVVGGTNGFLISGNNAANTIVLGSAAAGTATVNISGGATFGGTTQVFKNTSWTVNNVGITLGATGVYAPVIDGPGAGNVALLDAGTANVAFGGTLKPTFSVAPTLGSTWDLLHGAAVTGTFSSVQATGLGPGQRLSASVVGAAGDQNLRIAVSQVLSLSINRNTNAIAIANPGVASLSFDGYAIQSASGQLNVSQWNSIDDQNALGGDWLKSAGSNANHLAEAKPTSTGTMLGGTTQSLGSPYKANAALPFGTPNDDITFSYVNSTGTFTGDVTYTGINGINNFVLQVDPVSGKAQMKNTSGYNIPIDGYSITSTAGSLTSGTWNSFDDQNISDWLESTGSNTHKLTEAKPTSSTMMVGGTSTVQLGTIFAPASAKDLVFQFLQAGQSTLTTGVVIYESFGNADFDSDGDVDGADFLTWQRNLGASGGAATLANGNANGDGVINAADLAVWREQAGNIRPSAVAASGAVPEPPSWTLIGVALTALAGSFGRRRA